MPLISRSYLPLFSWVLTRVYWLEARHCFLEFLFVLATIYFGKPAAQVKGQQTWRKIFFLTRTKIQLFHSVFFWNIFNFLPLFPRVFCCRLWIFFGLGKTSRKNLLNFWPKSQAHATPSRWWHNRWLTNKRNWATRFVIQQILDISN